jgi:hypothetical protein
MTEGAKKKRGFATWDARKLQETAAKGGRAAHMGANKGHRFNSETARAAALKMHADRKAAKP